MTYEPPQGDPATRGSAGGASLTLLITVLAVVALIVAAVFWGPWMTDQGGAPREGIGVPRDEQPAPTPTPRSWMLDAPSIGYTLIAPGSPASSEERA